MCLPLKAFFNASLVGSGWAWIEIKEHVGAWLFQTMVIMWIVVSATMSGLGLLYRRRTSHEKVSWHFLWIAVLRRLLSIPARHYMPRSSDIFVNTTLAPFAKSMSYGTKWLSSDFYINSNSCLPDCFTNFWPILKHFLISYMNRKCQTL